jgi:Rieske Fe-S protein
MTGILIWRWILLIYHPERSCRLDGTVFYYDIVGIPVFVRRLTAEEVKNENEASQDSLLDKSKEVEFIYFKVVLTDAGNTKVLVISAVCTHLGCVPIPYLGAFNGWVCICHGSVYDKVTFCLF